MTLKRLSTIILLPLLFTGCGQISYLIHGSESHLEQLLYENEYHQALQFVDQLPEDDPLYRTRSELIKKITEQSSQYQNSKIEIIKKLEREQQWQEAITIANTACKKLPENKILSQERDLLLKKRDLYIEEQELQLAIEQATSLPKQATLLSSIEDAYFLDRNRSNYLKQTHEQLQSAHSRLIQAAETAKDKQQWELSYHYLLLANNITQDKHSTQLTSEVKEKIDSIKRNKEKSDQQQQQLAFSQLLSSFNTAINLGQLEKALTISSKLSQWNTQPEVSTLLTKLETIVNKKVKQLSNDAQALYSEGALDDAIRNWEKALAMQPENKEIEEKLHRAKEFKSKYEELKQQPVD